MNPDNIPAELRELNQWVCWRYEQRGKGKPTKVPRTIAGQKASSTEPSDWCSFQDACAAADRFDGIGFVFSGEDGLCGLDLDNCLNEFGALAPWAVEIMAKFDGTYSEVSPSGSGIKAFFRGSKPDGFRSQHKISGGQIELYGFGRFFTVTGETWSGGELADKQDAIDWLGEQYLRKRVEAGFRVANFSVMQKALAYVSEAEPAAEGERNNTAFRLAGHLAAIVGENYERLTEEQIVSLVGQWNLSNSPPMDDIEVSRTVASAMKNGTPREPKESDVWSRGGDVELSNGKKVDLSKILASLDGETKPLAQVPIPQMPEQCLKPPGILSEIIEYTLRTSMYPQPELALAGALALMATVTGRKLTDTYGTRTNVYILGLAPSGCGKEQARKTNKKLLYAAGCEQIIGPERIASSAGLVVCVHDTPAILLQIDEIGRLLVTLKRPEKAPHLYNIITVLMQLYSSSDSVWIGDAYADTKKVKKINQPHAVIYGTSVPESFWESLTVDNVSDGMLGRLMAFESQDGYVEPQTPEKIDPPPSLVSAIKWWADLNSTGGNLNEAHPKPIIAEYTKEAADRIDGHKSAIYRKQKNDDRSTTAIWMRSAEKAGKLALLFAASRSPMTPFFRVEIEDVDRAISLSNFLTRNIQRKVYDHVSDNDQEAKTKRVLRLLSEPLTKTQLTRKTQWLKRRERDEILSTLLDAELVEIDETDTGGRVPTRTVRRV